jgi:CrcB protein
MGIVTEYVMRRMAGSPEVRTFIATGMLGGFTTFSAFAIDFAALTRGGETVAATSYMLATLAGTLLAVYAGLAIGRWLW